MSSSLSRIDQAIAQRSDQYLALLANLVRCPSPLGEVRAAQQLLYRHARRIGLAAELWELDLDALRTHPHFASTPWSFAGQPNLTAVLPGSSEGGRTLVLNGHIDVVGPEPAQWWSFDPWGATVMDGRLYGRGALDMKSGLVAAMLAMQALLDSQVVLKGTVHFESVIEEECTGNGMLASRLRTGSVDGIVILEPTNRQTWMATPGVVWFDVIVRGKAAYVGNASDQINAIETAARLIGRLKPRIVAALNESFSHPLFTHLHLPLTLNVGVITGGDWPSKVPLECRFSCRMAFPIGWSFAEAQAFIERHVAAACQDDPWLVQNPPTLGYGGFRAIGWEADATGSLLRALSSAHQSTSHAPLDHTVFPGTADARYVSAAGEQAVYYGPTGGNIHAPDEYVELQSIAAVARTLTRLVIEWCEPA